MSQPKKHANTTERASGGSPVTDTCIHHNPSAICRECADPLDVTPRPLTEAILRAKPTVDSPTYRYLKGEITPKEYEALRAQWDAMWATPQMVVRPDPAAVPGWWAGIPILAAVLVLGIVIGWYTA